MSDITKGIQYLLDNTKKYPILGKKEQIELWQEYKAGDLNAKHKLLLHNIKYVVKIAHSYDRLISGTKVSLEDLVQQGAAGFLKSLDKYKPEKKASLVTCAYWWIKAEILDYITKNIYTIKVPRNKHRRKTNIREFSLNNSIASDSELEHLDVLEDQDALYNIEANIDLMWTKEKIFKAMRCLDRRERSIIRQRYLTIDPKTLAAIGRKWSLSRERIRQLEARALKKLKEHIEQEAA